MNETRSEARRNLAALLSALFLVLGGGIGAFLMVFFSLGPLLLGPFDKSSENSLLAIPVLIAFVLLFSVGAIIGGTIWVIVMSQILPKQTMYKWLTYGPQIKPLLDLHLWVLERMYMR